jgi:hypothetical protein
MQPCPAAAGMPTSITIRSNGQTNYVLECWRLRRNRGVEVTSGFAASRARRWNRRLACSLPGWPQRVSSHGKQRRSRIVRFLCEACFSRKSSNPCGLSQICRVPSFLCPELTERLTPPLQENRSRLRQKKRTRRTAPKSAGPITSVTNDSLTYEASVEAFSSVGERVPLVSPILSKNGAEVNF